MTEGGPGPPGADAVDTSLGLLDGGPAGLPGSTGAKGQKGEEGPDYFDPADPSPGEGLMGPTGPPGDDAGPPGGSHTVVLVEAGAVPPDTATTTYLGPGEAPSSAFNRGPKGAKGQPGDIGDTGPSGTGTKGFKGPAWTEGGRRDVLGDPAVGRHRGEGLQGTQGNLRDGDTRGTW